MPSFRITNKAKSDLVNIAHYTEKQWGRHQRFHYLKIIDAAFHLISESPALAQRCNYIAEGYFKYRVQNHLIFFKVRRDKTVIVIRVLHKRMDVVQHISP